MNLDGIIMDVEDIIKEEWRQFQLVNNTGGRASCQDNWHEFYIMRKSQFMTWPQEALESYAVDLCEASLNGSNLIFQKYAFMMKETFPEEYEVIRHALPEVSEHKQQLIENIVRIQTGWAQEFAEKYPYFSRQGRPVYAKDALPGETSIETYQRGELCTYSEKTLELYAVFVADCVKAHRNLTESVRENMAHLHGYQSVKDVEEQFSKSSN